MAATLQDAQPTFRLSGFCAMGAAGAVAGYALVVAFLGKTNAAALASNATTAALRNKLSIGAVAGALITTLLYLAALRFSPHWLAGPRVRAVSLLLLVPSTGLALLNRELWRTQALTWIVLTALHALLVAACVAQTISLSHRAQAVVGRVAGAQSTRARRLATGGVAILTIATALSLFLAARIRFQELRAGAFDLGISDNLIANALAGRFYWCNVFTGNVPTGPPMLAGHVQVGQWLFVPFYALRPGAETLLLIQATVCASGGLAVHLFARRRLGHLGGAVLAVAFLANPAVHSAATFEMTYLSVGSIAVLWALVALDAWRWPWVLLTAAIALSMREDMTVPLAIGAGFAALAGHRTRLSLLVAGLSAVVFVVLRFYVMRKAGAWNFPDLMYAGLIPSGRPRTFGTVITTLITNPAFVVGTMLTEKKLLLLLQLVTPLALLPLRRWFALAAFAPGFLLTLLTTGYDPTVSIAFHYPMHIAPYLFLVAALVLDPRLETPNLRGLVPQLAAVFVASSVVWWNLGVTSRPPLRTIGFAAMDWQLSLDERARYASLQRVIATLPRKASVVASDAVVPHVSSRPQTFLIEHFGAQDAEYLSWTVATSVEARRASSPSRR